MSRAYALVGAAPIVLSAGFFTKRATSWVYDAHMWRWITGPPTMPRFEETIMAEVGGTIGEFEVGVVVHEHMP